MNDGILVKLWGVVSIDQHNDTFSYPQTPSIKTQIPRFPLPNQTDILTSSSTASNNNNTTASPGFIPAGMGSKGTISNPLFKINTSVQMLEKDKKSSPSSPNKALESPLKTAYPTGPSNSMSFLISLDGTVLASYHKKNFFLYQREDGGGEFVLIGSGSGCSDSSERITTATLLPLYIPSSTDRNPIVLSLVVGYSSGFIRVFDLHARLLFANQCHFAAVKKVKLRSVQHLNGPANDGDELIILFKDCTVVAIDGGSFWMAIRVNIRLGDETMLEPAPSLTFHKWSFSNQSSINDIVSLGPAEHPNFFSPQFNVITGSYTPKAFTVCYVAVGRPMIALYATSETSSAFSLLPGTANDVTTVVASAVVSFAKSLWAPSAPAVHETQLGAASVRAVSVPCILELNDPHRHVSTIHLAPPSPLGDGQSPLAVMTDSLGRVMTFDVAQGHIVRLWKGVRDAQTGWIQMLYKSEETGKLSCHLFLAIYSPRGVLEVYQMRHGKRVALIHVGPDHQLIQTTNEMIGGVYWRLEEHELYKKLSSCYLISSEGEIKELVLDKQRIVSLVSVTSMVQSLKLLVSKLAASPEQQRPEVLDAIRKSILTAKDARSQLRGLEALNDDTPAYFILEMIEHLLKGLGVSVDTLEEDMFVVSRDSSALKQSTEYRIRNDLAFSRHLLLCYQDLQKLHQNLGDALPLSENISEGLQTKIDKYFLPATSTWKDQPIQHFCGPHTFLRCFVLRKNQFNDSKTATFAQDLDEDTRTKLVSALCFPALHFGVPIKGFYRTFKLDPNNWMTLALKFVKSHPFESFLRTTQERRGQIISNLLFLIQENIHDSRVIKLILEFIQSSNKIGYALLMHICLSHVVQETHTAEETVDLNETSFVLMDVLPSLEKCWQLCGFLPLPIQQQLGLTAMTIGKSEKLCPSRLVALNDIYVGSNITTSSDPSKLRQEFRAKIYDVFPDYDEDFVLIYMAFEYSLKWIETGRSTYLHHAINSISQIVSPILQTASAVGLFSHYISKTLWGIIDMLEKTRRVPNEPMFSRMCGMDEHTAMQFLNECAMLFDILDNDRMNEQELIAVTVAGKIKGLAVDALPPKLTKKEETVLNTDAETLVKSDANADASSVMDVETYFNDAVGIIVQMLSDESHQQDHLSSRLIQDHLLMVQVLQYIIKADLKLVRPLKLFSLDQTFCSSLFVNEDALETGGSDVTFSDPRLSAERVAFLTRLAEVDRKEAALMANAFGMQGNRLFSNGNPTR